MDTIDDVNLKELEIENASFEKMYAVRELHKFDLGFMERAVCKR